MRRVHPGQHERDVVTVTPRGKRESYVFCTEERSAKNGEGEKLDFAKGISVSISQACFVG